MRLINLSPDEVTEELVVKALGFMARRKWFKARVVVKGWNGQLTPACDILDKADMFDFVRYIIYNKVVFKVS